MLTTLELRRCNLRFSDEGICDPFALLFSLNNLKLLGCCSRVPFTVSGRQLQNLEIRCDPDSIGYGELRIGELSALKLESLYISGHAYDICDLNLVYLPSLARASVRLEWQQVGFPLRNREKGKFERVNRALLWLLSGMDNVKSLDLCLDSFVGKDSPLAGMKPLIEVELSRFTRLETLKVQYPRESPSMCDHMKALSLSL